ncbi:hypothetical protein, partial [Streptomyces sp. MBT56]
NNPTPNTEGVLRTVRRRLRRTGAESVLRRSGRLRGRAAGDSPEEVPRGPTCVAGTAFERK